MTELVRNLYLCFLAVYELGLAGVYTVQYGGFSPRPVVCTSNLEVCVCMCWVVGVGASGWEGWGQRQKQCLTSAGAVAGHKECFFVGRGVGGNPVRIFSRRELSTKTIIYNLL